MLASAFLGLSSFSDQYLSSAVEHTLSKLGIGEKHCMDLSKNVLEAGFLLTVPIHRNLMGWKFEILKFCL